MKQFTTNLQGDKMAVITRNSTTAAVDENGVLSGLIQQVSDGSPQYNENSQTYTAKFKGPYAILKNANNMVGKTLNNALSTLFINTYNNFTFPTPPADTSWYVIGTSVEQLDAGSHAILTVTCEAREESLTTEDG